MFTLALAQMHVESGAKERNVQRAAGMIAEAGAGGADLVLLPEALDLGWTHPSARREAEPVPDGAPFETLAAAARRHDVFVAAGLTERDGDRVYNAAVLLDPNGGLLLHHRKLNELAVAHALYDQGDHLAVARTELGTVGLHICADGFAPNQMLSRSLCYMGADVILSPGAWAVDADHDNEVSPYGQLWEESYRSVAKDFSVWIAGASCVGRLEAGPWQGRLCIGCSLVVDPDGGIAATGPYGPDAEAVLYVDIDPVPRPARGTEWMPEAP